MASLMDGFLSAGIEYPGRAGHIKKVVAYLQRTTRLNYRRVDIERVCEFLGHVEDKVPLLEKLVKLGVKQHPFRSLLNFRAGLLETGKWCLQLRGPEGAKVSGDCPEAGGIIDRAQGNGFASPDQERADLAQRDELAARWASRVRLRQWPARVPFPWPRR